MVLPDQKRILNDEQKKAVEFGDGPLLIIAGAGTGKTTVITERIKYLITSGKAKPEEILALTFTEKASREMEERVDLALPYGVTQMWISTFHAFCDRMLKNEGLAIGLDPNFKLMSEAEAIQFFRSNLFQFELSYFRPLGNPTKFIAGMLQHFSRLQDEDVIPNQYLHWVNSKIQMTNSKKNSNSKLQIHEEDNENEDFEKYKELAEAYRTYEELKTKHGMMDYGDLISYTLKLFRTRKGILKTYQKQFKYFLIDEFQDTNVAQNELAILLSGKKQNITVVGDDDQAIYRWRGAAISNIIQFRKHFKKAAVVVLTKNYRSTKEILDRSYDMIQHNNPDRLEVVENIDKKLECVRRIHGDPVKLLYHERVEDEADEVAETIKNLQLRITNDKKEQYSWKDVAILVRANAHAEPFVRALSRHGIPYQFLGPGQLLKQPEVKDLISYLKVLYDIGDTVALFRVLSMDHFAIPPRDIAALISYGREHGMTLFEVCEILVRNVAEVARPNSRVLQSLPLDARCRAPSVKNSNLSALPATDEQNLPRRQAGFIPSRRANNLTDKNIAVRVSLDGEKKVAGLFSMILKHLSFIKKETAGQILYFFLEESGLLKAFTSYKTVKEERAAENIAKLFNKLKTYEASHDDASVFAVVEWLDLSMTLGESPLAANADWNTYDAVNILTVHSAKGLEFPVVFITNLVAQRFPTSERHEQIPIPDALVKEILPKGDYHLEEERRLFYVAMTRARDHLYLTGAKYYGEGKREKKLSSFIGEAIGEDHIKEALLRPFDFAQGYGGQGEEKESQLFLLDWKKSEEPEHAPVRTPITYISYSQVETFRRCPLQYKYRHVIKIPVPPSAALSFGDTIHRTLHAFYELKQKHMSVSKAVLLETYKNEWSPFGYNDRKYETKMKLHGETLLKDFYDKGFDAGTVVVGLEQSFKIRLTPELVVGGKIDRIDRKKDGMLEIIDYKTGSAPKKKDVSSDMQLSVYALAATEKSLYGEKPENVIVSFYFLEGQEIVSATRGKEQLEQAKEDIKQTAEDIRVSMFPATPGKHCDFCEFRLICEAWK